MPVKMVLVFLLVISLGTACFSKPSVSISRNKPPVSASMNNPPVSVPASHGPIRISLHTGVTKRAEVLQVLGPPHGVQAFSDSEHLIWDHVQPYIVTITAGNNPPTVTEYTYLWLYFSAKNGILTGIAGD
jgi:hypothetical protein